MSRFQLAAVVLLMLALFEVGFISGQLILFGLSSSSTAAEFRLQDRPGRDFTVSKYAFNTTAVVRSGIGELVVSGTSIIFDEGSRFRFSSSGLLTVESGTALIKTNSPVSVELSAQTVRINGDSLAIYSAEEKQLLMLAGSATANEQTALANQSVSENSDAIRVADFDRSNYASNVSLQRFTKILTDYSVLPEQLEDLTPPVLSQLSPANNSVTDKQTISVSGKTEPGARVMGASTEVNVAENGSFSFEVQLSGAENEIKLIATDVSGNKTEQVLKILFRQACTGSQCNPDNCSGPDCPLNTGSSEG
jgi:hypothetical protein